MGLLIEIIRFLSKAFSQKEGTKIPSNRKAEQNLTDHDIHEIERYYSRI